jgi:photosystem II stability/assembly factor-like uncharacterized protein
MTKKILFTLIAVVGLSFLYFNVTKESEIEKIKKQHATFLENHPFNEAMALNKKERIAQGLPPNKFNEQDYLNSIDPTTGKTNPTNIFNLQKELNAKRLASKTPGTDEDLWVERGPNNVGGRVRAAMFDPNDATNETVYAGGVSGGLWRNTKISDENTVWERVGIPENLAISSITVDPNNSMIWYLGTGESYVGHTTGSASGDGLWKTTDGGETWVSIFGGSSGDSFFQSGSKMTINSPSSIAGDYATFPTTAFGTEITTDITSNIVLVDDGSAAPSEGCNALTNGSEVSGKIALIRRGNCNFDDKVKNAENAGAIAVIMMNNVAGSPIPMGGDDTTIAIPSVMISKEYGDLIEAALSNDTVNITLSPASGNFTAVVVPGQQHINDVKVKDNNGVSEIYLAVSDANYGATSSVTYIGALTYGLYKSVDNGTTWTELDLPLTVGGNKHCPNDIEIGADGKVWVSTTSSKTYGDGGGIIFSSADGVTFTQSYAIPAGNRTQIEVSATNAFKVYALAQLDSGGSVVIIKTTSSFLAVNSASLPNDADTGITETDFTRGQSFYNLLLNIDPANDENIFVGGIDLFKSNNGGSSWTQFSHWYGGFGFQEVHSDQHIAAFANNSSTRMVFGNDGGIYFTDDAGATTVARNNGLNITQFYTVGVAPTTAFEGKDYFVAGAQDNGTQLFEDSNAGIDGSTEPYGGDGAYSFFDQDGTDQYFIRNYVYNDGINLFNFKTNSSITVNSESASNGSFINEEELDSELNILYSNYSSGTNYIIKRYKGLTSIAIQKTDLTDPLLTGPPRAMKVSPYTTDSSKLLVGTVFGDLLKVDNADGDSPVWSDISGSGFVGSISDIEYGQTENDIFVTMHNYNVVSIWATSDGGETWLNKEGDFPDIPVKTILQNPLNLEEVLIGTELGVWKTSNFSATTPTWVQSNNGMSNVKVLDLDLRDDNKVFACTHGRGIFSGDFTAATASVDTVLSNEKSFTVYPTVSNGNFTIYAKSDLGTSNVIIFDINGKQVYKSLLDFNDNEKQEVSLNLNAGVYIVNVIDNNNKKSSNKIVIE